MKWLFRITLFFFLLAIVGQFFMPRTVANAMESALEEQWQLQEVQVNIHAFPAIKILTGNVDKAEIFVPSTIFGGLPVNNLYIELYKINVNVISVLQKDFDYEMHRAGTVQFIITEEGLNEYLQANPISGLGNVSVELSQDISSIHTQVTILGSQVNFTLLGRFILKDGNLIFLPEDLKVDNYSLGDMVKDKFEAGTNFEFKLGDLPYDTKLDRLESAEKKITVYGTIGLLEI